MKTSLVAPIVFGITWIIAVALMFFFISPKTAAIYAAVTWAIAAVLYVLIRCLNADIADRLNQPAR